MSWFSYFQSNRKFPWAPGTSPYLGLKSLKWFLALSFNASLTSFYARCRKRKALQSITFKKIPERSQHPRGRQSLMVAPRQRTLYLSFQKPQCKQERRWMPAARLPPNASRLAFQTRSVLLPRPRSSGIRLCRHLSLASQRQQWLSWRQCSHVDHPRDLEAPTVNLLTHTDGHPPPSHPFSQK